MPIHPFRHLSALFRSLTGSTQLMAFKRHFNYSKCCRNPKKMKLQLSQHLHERQWETVYTPEDESDWFKFTIASYNVLSQNLLETNKHLYKNCQSKHLTWKHRKSIIRDELHCYQPDILCLQEVQFHEYSKFFLPELQRLGYFGLYKKRTSDKEDGCATFFKRDKFTCVSSKAMEYKKEGVNILDRDNVGLILLLKVNPPKNKNIKDDDSNVNQKLKDVRLCVANTHLLFNPKRGDIKLAQLITLIAGIDEVTGGSNESVIICGDLNSHPKSGIYDFLLSGRVDVQDVPVRFFSGQLSPNASRSFDESSMGLKLSQTFLGQVKDITDQCQFVDVLKNRKGDKNLSKKLDSTLKPDQKRKSEDLDAKPSYTMGSRIITHGLKLESAYDHRDHVEEDDTKQITCYVERECNTVDYILYSDRRRLPSDSTKESTDLRLLKRFKLFTESQIKSHYLGMPNADLGSDHTILLSELAIKL